MSLSALICTLQIVLRQLSFGPTQDLSVLNNNSCESVQEIDEAVEAYMKKYEFHGAQLAVMKNDALVYCKGYGYSDAKAGTLMEASDIMRIASVSKLVTAVGIMKMEEMGLLSLNDKVFGPEGILNDNDLCSCIRDKNIYKISVEDLLRHKGGFSARRYDPMFSVGNVDPRETLKRELRRRLAFMPGKSQEYSNLGYYILSLVIEKLGRDSYENWMRHNVLIPMHCYNFRIAGNYLGERYTREVRYHMQRGSEPRYDYHGNGNKVEQCYGGNNVSGVLGAGAWVTSAPELCRFVAGIDGDWGLRDILSSASVARMTEYFDEKTYSLGWNDTNQYGVWTRTGSFSGTTAIVKYFENENECWVLLTNTSTFLGPRIASRSSRLIRHLRKFSDKLPSKDLFYR